MSRRMHCVGLLLLAGCGFSALPNGADLAGDLAGVDLSGIDLSGVDLSGVDLSGVDLTGADLSGADLTPPPDLAITSGPGPLGALPPGFCCSTDEECRSRSCVSSAGGAKYCTDGCDVDATCSVWNAAFSCAMPSGQCAPTSTPYTCRPASLYSYGTKPNGSCCSQGFPQAGQECLGGLCATTGLSSNPFYCTQGCNANTRCPANYTCAAGFCWIGQSFADPNFAYTCN